MGKSMNKKRQTSKSKSRHTTTKPAKRTKTRPRYREKYTDMLGWREKPLPMEAIIDLAKDFWQFAYEHTFNTNKPRPVSLTRWRIKVGLPYSTYKTWYAKYPAFKWIVDEAKEMLGVIREEGMMMRELDVKSTMWTMHNYSQEWRDYNAYHDNRAKEIRAEGEESRMLQPVMLSADEFEKALKEKKDTV